MKKERKIKKSFDFILCAVTQNWLNHQRMNLVKIEMKIDHLVILFQTAYP